MKTYTYDEVVELIKMPVDLALTKVNGESELISTSEAANILGVTRRTLHNYINTGLLTIAHKNLARHNMFSKQEVLTLKDDIEHTPIDYKALK